MPAIGVNITHNNGTLLPITTPIEITIPNLEQNINFSRTHNIFNVTRGMIINYVLHGASQDEALVVEIVEG